MIVIAVTFGRIYAKRKQHRQLQQRIDLERQEQTRRGEAAGLPTYIDHGRTVAVPMPNLPYPEAAYRPEAIHGDPSLPGYENAPPKYEYGHLENAPAAPAPPTTPGGTAIAAPTPVPSQQPEMQEAPRQAGQMHIVTSPAVSPAAIERREADSTSMPVAAGATSRSQGMETVPLDDMTARSSDAQRTEQRT